MSKQVPDWIQSVKDTDQFYEAQNGLSYSDEKVERWLSKWFWPFVDLRGDERILDLCCGDGVWSIGLMRRFPTLTVVGADVSQAAVKNANARATDLGIAERARFFCHDCENNLPFQSSSFDLIFARGLFVYNQHDMLRSGCLGLFEHWHGLLVPGGRFVAMYGSKPERFGTYTPAHETKGLPTNLSPRETPSTVFHGGKFNHSPTMFLLPFLEMSHALLIFY